MRQWSCKSWYFVVGVAWLGGLATLPNVSNSEESGLTLSIAEGYFKALYMGDYDRVREIAAPEMRFSDPTAEGQEAVITSAANREEFLEYMEAVMPPPSTEIRHVIDSSFQTGGFAVLVWTYRGEVSEDESETKGGSSGLETKGVTILRVEDGKVVEHHDYVDYETLQRQLASQMRQ